MTVDFETADRFDLESPPSKASEIEEKNTVVPDAAARKLDSGANETAKHLTIVLGCTSCKQKRKCSIKSNPKSVVENIRVCFYRFYLEQDLPENPKECIRDFNSLVLRYSVQEIIWMRETKGLGPSDPELRTVAEVNYHRQKYDLDIDKIPGLTEEDIRTIRRSPYYDLDRIIEANPEYMAKSLGFSEERCVEIILAVKSMCELGPRKKKKKGR